jgi:predicted GNAT family acetyltransferase
MSQPDSNFTFNEEASQFQLVVEGHTAFIEFSRTGDIIILPHTEVPAALEGRGIGKQLVEQTLTYIENHGWKVVPLCPFVSAYIKRHPEWERIVLKRG